MKFDYVVWITSPYILMFLAIFTGIILGNIKIGKFNFGASGCLFTGLFIGWVVYRYGLGFQEGEKGYQAVQNMLTAGVIPSTFFTLFLIFFVVAVGLLAAKDLGAVLKKYGLKFVILGFLITLSSAMATYGMVLLGPSDNPYEISGVYTGALTSSPGLAAAIETAKAHATERVIAYESVSIEDKQKFIKILDPSGELTPETLMTLNTEERSQFVRNAEAGIGLGYAVAYPFGVLVVILAINFLPKIFKMNVEKEKERFKQEMTEARMAVKGRKEIAETNFDIIAFTIACFFGYSIGTIEIYLGSLLGYFSLGATGGALIGSLILGYIGKIGFINFRMNSKILSVVRELSLCFFLAIVGLRYGYQVFDAIMGTGVFLALTSLSVGIVGILVGYLVGRYVFKLNWIMLAGAICGGMTSTPGLGVAIDSLESDDPAAGYGAVYPFALLGMVLFTILLHRLPM
ncbi:putative transport protein [Anaerovirgula multivorans]|uniref:Putative transport protein n=1 Tax=Anaerovirgula multivorans TaxID=312168 RepID=A0A239L1B5_9FIRM|nr:hypothetical protein [Anaerovirgula multivorans]SNT23529.1 putative transport protein [Anaerovirgula multivorans]